MSSLRRALVVGLLVGAFGVGVATVPVGTALEDSLGLEALFRARGAQGHPPGVVVVSVDDSSAARLHLSPKLRDWPRSLHAQLIDALVDRGASTIAFDVEFFSHRENAEDDRFFAEAIARSGRTLLIQRIDLLAGGVKIQDPIPPLRQAALGLAPVPLPDAEPVTRFYTFLRAGAGDELPTLPSMALQIHALPALTTFTDMLERLGAQAVDALPAKREEIKNNGDVSRLMKTVRRVFVKDPTLASRARKTLESGMVRGLNDADRNLMQALVELYDGNPSWYLNFYGPPGSICTIPYHAIIDGDKPVDSACDVADKVVFVGSGMSPLGAADQVDAYKTVFSQPNGVDLSGVEIHATALANLLARNTLHPVGSVAYLSLLFIFGGSVASAAFLIRIGKFRSRAAVGGRVRAVGLTLVLAVLYYGGAQALFSQHHLLVPLAIPLLTQLPVALVLALVIAPGRVRESVHGVCLLTDVRDYTKIVARLGPEHASRLMGEYFLALAVNSGASWRHCDVRRRQHDVRVARAEYLHCALGEPLDRGRTDPIAFISRGIGSP